MILHYTVYRYTQPIAHILTLFSNCTKLHPKHLEAPSRPLRTLPLSAMSSAPVDGSKQTLREETDGVRPRQSYQLQEHRRLGLGLYRWDHVPRREKRVGEDRVPASPEEAEPSDGRQQATSTSRTIRARATLVTSAFTPRSPRPPSAPSSRCPRKRSAGFCGARVPQGSSSTRTTPIT